MKQQTYVGYHSIAAILKRDGTSGTLYIHGAGARTDELRKIADAAGVSVVEVDQRRIARLGGAAARNAVLVASVAGGPRLPLNEALRRLTERPAGAQEARTGDVARVVLALDHITDPQNLGAILRSADQFAVDLVLVPGRRSAPLSDAVMRASAGAAATVPVVEVGNLAQALTRLKDEGFWIYGADMDGAPVDRERLSGRVVLVLGSEGGGLSKLVRDRCDVMVRIPTGGSIDSLNVSVSAGIFLYEITRQQQRFRS